MLGKARSCDPLVGLDIRAWRHVVKRGMATSYLDARYRQDPDPAFSL